MKSEDRHDIVKQSFNTIDVYSHWGTNTCCCLCCFPTHPLELDGEGGSDVMAMSPLSSPSAGNAGAASTSTANTYKTAQVSSAGTSSMSRYWNSVTSCWRKRVVQYQWVKPAHLVTSYFVSNPAVILLTRTLITLYLVATLIAELALYWNYGYFFVYFTHLSFIGLTVYFIMATYLSLQYWKLGPQSTKRQQASRLEIVTSWFYTSSFTIHVIVPLVYWLLLSSTWKWDEKDDKERWTNITVHGLDLFVILVEFFMNRVVYVWGHLAVTTTIFLLYIPYSWIFAACYPTSGPSQNGFPYFFVNYNNPLSAVFIVALAVLLMLVWLFSFGLHYLRAYQGNKYRQRRTAQ